jgi:deoxycytidylate deaminase
MSKFLKIAYKMADRSGADNHKLAALVVRGGAIISSSTNLGRYGRCAERRALRPHLDLEGCTLYVVRAKGYVSKPCGKCMRAIAEAGIKWVVYINELRQVEEVKVDNVSMIPLAPVFQTEQYFVNERW